MSTPDTISHTTALTGAAQRTGTTKRAATKPTTSAKRAASAPTTGAKKRTSNSKPATATTARRSTKSRSTSASVKRRPTTTAKRGAARKVTPTSTIGTVGSYAERAVLIPVGAALIARDRLLAGVGELPRDRSDITAKTQAQLHRFERRGTSARNSLEREARRTRVKIERELRRRRHSLDHAMNDLEKRRGSLSHAVSDQFEGASSQIERTLQARVKEVSSLAEKVQGHFRDLI